MTGGMERYEPMWPLAASTCSLVVVVPAYMTWCFVTFVNTQCFMVCARVRVYSVALSPLVGIPSFCPPPHSSTFSASSPCVLHHHVPFYYNRNRGGAGRGTQDALRTPHTPCTNTHSNLDFARLGLDGVTHGGSGLRRLEWRHRTVGPRESNVLQSSCAKVSSHFLIFSY